MLHRDNNANLVRGSYCGRYRKRLPDRLQGVALSRHFPLAEEHDRSMARHHLRRIGSMPSDARSGKVEAVLGQRG